MRRLVVATAALVATGALASTTASAYVRSRTAKGVPVAWSTSCTYVTPDLTGTPDLPSAQLFEIVRKSMANWTNAVAQESYLKLVYNDPVALEAHLDGVNTVKFRTDRWCHPNDAQQKDICYSSAAAGITTV
ncbi:MAG: hypothetical protein LC659_15645, partial [Myxococcales bacterium]|nr:hypothetical protein [Myxococcales bacterium]